jgi:hypothetical protein
MHIKWLVAIGKLNAAAVNPLYDKIKDFGDSKYDAAKIECAEEMAGEDL